MRTRASASWHLIGALAMWSGVACSAAAVLFLMPRAAGTGASVFAASVLVTGLGAWLKKRHCPRCAAGADACEAPVPRQGH